MNNTEIVVFDLELEIINSLALRYGLAELRRDIPAPNSAIAWTRSRVPPGPRKWWFLARCRRNSDRDPA
jgi:hypothetical protein